MPKDREELLLRTPLTFGFSAPSNMYQPQSNRDVSRTVLAIIKYLLSQTLIFPLNRQFLAMASVALENSREQRSKKCPEIHHTLVNKLLPHKLANVIIAVSYATGRVRQMKGLTNEPICSVEDNCTRPRPMSALTDRDLGSGYIPPGSSRYSANVNKQLFAVGVGQSVYIAR